VNFPSAWRPAGVSDAFPSAWRPAGVSDAPPVSRHNQQRSVEEGRSLLGGNHAMKTLKLSVGIPEGLSTGVNMDVSAPHLIHKWLR
jgi:hypothetical protein